MFKKLSIVAATAVAGLALTAAPGHAADLERADCYVSCTKTLKPGERLVVGNPFAYTQVNISGRETGFGTHFVVKNSTNGATYTKVGEAYGPAFSQSYQRALTPYLFPGFFRAIAINESTWLNQTVTLSVNAM